MKASAKVARELDPMSEFVYTPMYDSWLNMLEIERRVLVGQCLKRKLPDVETPSTEVWA